MIFVRITKHSLLNASLIFFLPLSISHEKRKREKGDIRSRLIIRTRRYRSIRSTGGFVIIVRNQEPSSDRKEDEATVFRCR